MRGSGPPFFTPAVRVRFLLSSASPPFPPLVVTLYSPHEGAPGGGAFYPLHSALFDVLETCFQLTDARPPSSGFRRFAHYTDTPLTEKLDYFSAALVILYALYMTVVRLFHLYPGTPGYPSRPGRRAFFRVWRALVAVAYIGHVAYLGLAPRFDYTYNIMFNLGLGLVHHALWLLFALPGSSPFARYSAMRRSYRPAHAGTAALTVALTTAATALELFDFPPWGRVLDAHALWHFATAPLAVLWYDFLLTDALDAGWKGQRL